MEKTGDVCSYSFSHEHHWLSQRCGQSKTLQLCRGDIQGFREVSPLHLPLRSWQVIKYTQVRWTFRPFWGLSQEVTLLLQSRVRGTCSLGLLNQKHAEGLSVKV